MDLDEYQDKATASAVYPGSGTGSTVAVTYCGLGLTGKSGETAEKIKKVLRDDNGKISEETKERIARELGDVMWYAASLAKELGYKLSDIARINLEKIADRRSRGALHGSGDDR